MVAGTDLYKAFYAQRQRAKQRGVVWELTFEDWIQVWIDSGHLDERGKGRGKYCMARFSDSGPYKIGNIKIIPYGQNISEQQYSEERKLQRSLRMMGNKYGIGHTCNHTEETRKLLSEKLKGNTNAIGHTFA